MRQNEITKLLAKKNKKKIYTYVSRDMYICFYLYIHNAMSVFIVVVFNVNDHTEVLKT